MLGSLVRRTDTDPMKPVGPLVVALALLGGCTVHSTMVGDGPRGTVQSYHGLDGVVRRAPCDSVTVPGPAGPEQLARYPAVAVIRCETRLRHHRGDGVWQVLVRQVSTHGVPALLRALELPDDPPAHRACPGIGYRVVPYLLTDGGGVFLHPRAPEDGCGAPQQALRTAEEGLVWRTVSVERVARDRR